MRRGSMSDGSVRAASCASMRAAVARNSSSGTMALTRRLAHRGRPEVVRDLVDQRGHHFLARIGVAHAAAYALLGDADGTELPARPAGVAPDARAGGRLEEPRGQVAADLGAHAPFHPGDVGDLEVHARVRVRDVAEENGRDAVLLADFPERGRIELLRAERAEERLAPAKLDEARARLRRLDLLLELPRGARAERALGVRIEFDDTDAVIAAQVDARRHGNDDRVSMRAGGEQRERAEQAAGGKAI